MKNYLRTLLVISIASICLFGNAQQKLKIGHINSQELYAAMPESDSARKKYDAVVQEHETIYEEMVVEYNKKREALDKAQGTGSLSDLAKTTKEAELQDLMNRIQTFQQTAQQDLQQKEVEFFTPVRDKALKAVNSVAEENGFTYILDTGTGGAVVYWSPDAVDILPLVKTKLGIQ
jgi:outer membrane protein